MVCVELARDERVQDSQSAEEEAELCSLSHKESEWRKEWLLVESLYVYMVLGTK